MNKWDKKLRVFCQNFKLPIVTYRKFKKLLKKFNEYYTTYFTIIINIRHIISL